MCYGHENYGSSKPCGDLIIISLLGLKGVMNVSGIDQPTQTKMIEVLKNGRVGEIDLPNHILTSKDSLPRDIH